MVKGFIMPLFHNQERLINALQILNDSRGHITAFYQSILGLQVRADGIERLRDAFRASVSERRGASFNRGNAAFQEFDNRINAIVEQVNLQINENPEQAHRILFKAVVMLPNIDQKIAAMFIKFLVVYLDVWPSMLPFLFVPLDRVVLKILGEKLQVYIGGWNNSPSIKNPSGRLYVRGNQMSAQYARFTEFQNEIGEIAQQANVPRILADELWFVGYIFCKEYPLCQRCWMREICQGIPFN